jgi:hypothetical protein
MLMGSRSVLANVSLALVTAFAVWRPFAAPAAGRDAAAGITAAGAGTPAAAPPAADPRVRRGCDLLAEYLGRTDAQRAAPTPTPATERPPCAPDAAAGRGLDPPLIVVLPDPLDSRLDWAFDGGIEAVRRAYERTGYLLDRFWLPWAVDADTLHGKPREDAGLRRTAPGVLLFKRAPGATGSDPRGEMRLVYVVGELATGGVDQAVFDSALVDRCG